MHKSAQSFLGLGPHLDKSQSELPPLRPYNYCLIYIYCCLVIEQRNP